MKILIHLICLCVFSLLFEDMAAVATGMPTRAPDFTNCFNNASLISATTVSHTSSSYPPFNKSTMNASSSFNNAATTSIGLKPAALVNSNESILLTGDIDSSSSSNHFMQRASNLPIRKPPQPPNPSNPQLSAAISMSKRKPVLAESLIKKIQKITSNQKPVVMNPATTTATTTKTKMNTSNRHSQTQAPKSTDSSSYTHSNRSQAPNLAKKTTNQS